MRPSLLPFAASLVLALAPAALAAAPRAVVVDGFETLAPWTANPADGVSLVLASDTGADGRAMRLDFDFHGGGGYAVARRAVSLDLSGDWRFTFRMRGACRPNNLEFKLVDASGENVWWVNRRDVEFSKDWSTVTIKKRHVSFAWGPLGGGEPGHVAALEFAVTAGQGGRGSVWLDDLRFERLPAAPAVAPAPVAGASSGAGAAARAFDRDTTTAWTCPAGGSAWWRLDFGVPREFGGLRLEWAPGRHAADFAVEVSDDAKSWRVLHDVRGAHGGASWVWAPECEARFVRVRIERAAAAAGAALAEVVVLPLEASASRNAFFAEIARRAPRGAYPRGTLGENTFWTVVGPDADPREALVDEYGRIEPWRGEYAIEPFLRDRGRLVTWADVRTSQSLAEGRLPIPSVEWAYEDLRLRITVVPIGNPGRAALLARYRLTNTAAEPRRDTLFLAVRPFQVNPPVQFLNTPGGFTPVREIAMDDRIVRVNGDRGFASLTAPFGGGTVAFAQGDVVDFLREGALPRPVRMTDRDGLVSGAIGYAFDLAAGGSAEAVLVLPLHEPPAAPGLPPDSTKIANYADAMQRSAENAWRARQDRVTVQLPDSDVVNALKAQLAYVLVNRNGPAIQPGTRAYARSWIRDGSLTSSALLRLGETQAVRDFIRWFAPYQYANGKAPCCVDARGADPVPEHDSSGELIYLVTEYYRYTGDRAFADSLWPRVAAAAGYLDTLRAQRRTDDWRTAGGGRFHGLLPPSISHEGYSAKPMHSYWDDFGAARLQGRRVPRRRTAQARACGDRAFARRVRGRPGRLDPGHDARAARGLRAGLRRSGRLRPDQHVHRADAGRRRGAAARRRARAHLRALLGLLREAPRRGRAVGRLHAVRVAQRRRHGAARLARPRAGSDALVPRQPATEGLPALGRGRDVRRARVALPRRHAAHVVRHRLRAFDPRHARVRARSRFGARRRGGRHRGVARRRRGGARPAHAVGRDQLHAAAPEGARRRHAHVRVARVARHACAPGRHRARPARRVGAHAAGGRRAPARAGRRHRGAACAARGRVVVAGRTGAREASGPRPRAHASLSASTKKPRAADRAGLLRGAYGFSPAPRRSCGSRRGRTRRST
ncbi:MAG: discoidin domain-containing protein [Candidatus Eisenbacteria bacterium]